MNKKIYNNIKDILGKNNNNFFLIAGPCVLENKKDTINIAKRIKEITSKLEIPFIFKASYKKANRTRIDSFSGIGDIKALEILKQIKETLHVNTITDIHSAEEAKIASQYVDALQIPAFLCRQTDILIAAAKTKKIINIKKGQFMSPDSMKHAINKIKKYEENILITERGTMFGYQDLVVDFRSIHRMKEFNCPIILDVTHSLQSPNQEKGITSGNPEMIETISKAGIASGVNGIFLETHPNPEESKSDGANMLKLDKLENLLLKLIKIKSSIS